MTTKVGKTETGSNASSLKNLRKRVPIGAAETSQNWTDLYLILARQPPLALRHSQPPLIGVRLLVAGRLLANLFEILLGRDHVRLLTGREEIANAEFLVEHGADAVTLIVARRLATGVGEGWGEYS